MSTAGSSLTLRTLHRTLAQLLEPAAHQDAPTEANWLLQAVFEDGSGLLLSRGGEAVSPAMEARCIALVQRRLAGEPLQYILGEWDFMGLPFRVGSGVLIPRPETEELAALALRFLENLEQPLTLDLCSGSGCIPVSIAHRCPRAQCWGVELSADAFRYFETNISLNRAVNVTAVQSDALAPDERITCRRYHLVTANPPYIATGLLPGLQREVQREPAMALDGGGDGLDFYRKLPGVAAGLLRPGGLLAMEIGDEQAEPVLTLVRQAGFMEAAAHKDLSGNYRIVTGLQPEL